MGFKYGSVVRSWTPAAHADGATPANSTFHALGNRAVTDVTKLKRVLITGEAIATAVNSMALRRLSTTATTPTDVSPGPLSPGAPASGPKQFVLTGGGLVIASTTHLLGAGFNCFGGIIGLQITPDDEPLAVGTATPNKEFILDAVTGTGLVTTDIVFEQV
jgi:hypothetical protein